MIIAIVMMLVKATMKMKTCSEIVVAPKLESTLLLVPLA